MLIPTILSGGTGTRLWPVSREACPKPFIRLADGETLIEKTYRRAAMVAGAGELLTVTNRDYYFMSKDALAQVASTRPLTGRYLLEPVGRNTAPAIALAAHWVAARHGRDACLLVLAADHLIQDPDAFLAAVARAEALARQDRLVTFGILPTAPDSGFGYIEAGAALGEGRQVVRFVEKPDRATAEGYLAAGNFFWNAGMFCFRAGVILDALARHAPALADACQALWTDRLAAGAADLLDIPAEPFARVPSISLDYAVMEVADNVAVVPAEFGWSDVGSWAAISALTAPDDDNNRANGQAIFVDAANTYVQSHERLVAAVGVDNLIVIDTPDALLVARSDQVQKVKAVVAQLKAQDHEAFRLHRTVARPWGTYTVLEAGPRFKIKRIEVRPGHRLSLQMHHHRSEHWVVVSGIAKVTSGEQECFVRANESTYIPAGQPHRLENPGLLDLVMIEVQSGEYLGEDDIVRFDDQYGRSRDA